MENKTGNAAVLYDKQITGREVVIVAPDRQSGAASLIVALHGCDQKAMEFLESTGLDRLVDREDVVLALPQARAGGGNPLGCWQWWDPDNQRRDGEDSAHILEITRSMDVNIDPQRVYALGFSSGGAMAMIVGTVLPDVFAAIGIHSGVGFAAAGNVTCALKTLDDPPGNAAARGELGYLHQPVIRMVPTMIVHGTEDEVVDPEHVEALVEELAQRNDLIDDGDGNNDSFDTRPDSRSTEPGQCTAEDTDSCYPYIVEYFEDWNDETMIGRVLIEGLGHAWSGGGSGQIYADIRGPDAGNLFWTFFNRHQLTASPPAPQRHCRDWQAPPWWHYTWAGTMDFREYTCDMNPWSMVWRHRIGDVAGPGRCP